MSSIAGIPGMAVMGEGIEGIGISVTSGAGATTAGAGCGGPCCRAGALAWMPSPDA